MRSSIGEAPVIPDDPTQPPVVPRPAQLVPLDYALPAAGRPGSITAIGVIGIIMASAGLLVGLAGGLQSIGLMMLRGMGWPPPVMIVVSMGEAVAGAALASALLVGSIALLRLLPWSRRVLLWWAWMYLLADVVILLLQILIVAPAQMDMYAKMFAAVPPAAPTTIPVNAVAVRTSTVNVSSSGVTVVPGGRAVASSRPGMPGAPAPAPIAMAMQTVFIATASGKAVICVIFPVVMLIELRSKRVRDALASA